MQELPLNEQHPVLVPVTKLEMPTFHQLPNACGLSALLMALRPDAREIAPILDEFWEIVAPLFRERRWQGRREFRWTLLLEYLLLKGMVDEEIREASYGAMPDFYDVYVVVSQMQVREVHALLLRRFGSRVEPLIERYYGDGLLYEELVLRRILKMKENPELKLLAWLFGCEFVPWGKSLDGTGAVTFTREEVKSYRKGNPTPEFGEKLNFLREGLEAEDPVLLGSTHHWLAVRDLLEFDGKYFVTYHDPATAKEVRKPLDRFTSNDFFYRFHFDPALAEGNVPLVRGVLERDVPAEVEAAAVEGVAVVQPPGTSIELVARGVEIESGQLSVEGDTGREVPPEIETGAGVPPATDQVPPEAPERIPGETFVQRLRRIIRSNFSDYRSL
ncbi:MAG: hypothetical protein ACTSU5_14840 [Promethearchaeota archaeon]